MAATKKKPYRFTRRVETKSKDGKKEVFAADSVEELTAAQAKEFKGFITPYVKPATESDPDDAGNGAGEGTGEGEGAGEGTGEGEGAGNGEGAE